MQPTHEGLVADLKLIRAKGITRIRNLALPHLKSAAALTGDLDSNAIETPGATATAIESLLRRAVNRIEGIVEEGARYIYGLRSGLRGRSPTELRRMAAEARGISPGSFRKEPEQIVHNEVADHVLALIVEAETKRSAADRDQLDSPSATPEEAKDGTALVLKVGQALGAGGIYEILDAASPEGATEEGAVPPGSPAHSLGQGGSGTVYLALFNDMQKRAIKFLTQNYLAEETGRRSGDFKRVFKNEKGVLSTLSHGNIAQLYDVGTYVDEGGHEWEYLVTEYINGDELLDAMRDDSTSPQCAFDLVTDVLLAVQYMHSMKVLHGDIKHQNIKCRKSPAYSQAVLLDLGTAHKIDDPLPADSTSGRDSTEPHQEYLAYSEERARFIASDRITHELHKKYRNRVVDQETLSNELFPWHDLHALGVLLRELLEVPEIEQKLVTAVGVEGRHALETMVIGLFDAPQRHHDRESRSYYKSIDEVIRDWRKLPKGYLAPLGVPELSLAAEYKFSIPTSAGRAVITPRLGKLLDHKLVQRLRIVPQLEMTLFKYPGANHSRLAHSIAVLHNTRYYLAQLLNDPNFRLMTEAADLQATLILALLHDVGHYQLSHMFEDFSADQRIAPQSASWKDVKFDIPLDDDLFWPMVDPDRKTSLRGDYGEVILKAVRDSERELGLTTLPRPTIAEIVVNEFGQDTYDAMQGIHDALYGNAHDTRPAHFVLGAVLSSDIDVDKVSYLPEDSMRSGVQYGQGVALDGLLSALRAPEIGEIGGKPTIGITRFGVTAAQSVSTNRNQMVNQVYWHYSNRAATSMVKYVIARLLEKKALSMKDFLGQTLFSGYEATLKYLL
jgi:HD superfamily phosphohydrolase